MQNNIFNIKNLEKESFIIQKILEESTNLAKTCDDLIKRKLIEWDVYWYFILKNKTWHEKIDEHLDLYLNKNSHGINDVKPKLSKFKEIIKYLSDTAFKIINQDFPMVEEIKVPGHKNNLDELIEKAFFYGHEKFINTILPKCDHNSQYCYSFLNSMHSFSDEKFNTFLGILNKHGYDLLEIRPNQRSERKNSSILSIVNHEVFLHFMEIIPLEYYKNPKFLEELEQGRVEFYAKFFDDTNEYIPKDDDANKFEEKYFSLLEKKILLVTQGNNIKEPIKKKITIL